MQVFVYKSAGRRGRWLYLAERDAFAAVPAGLLTAFGPPQFVLCFDPERRKGPLPAVDAATLTAALEAKGYYLRLDAGEPEDLLNAERQRRGLADLPALEVRDFFH